MELLNIFFILALATIALTLFFLITMLRAYNRDATEAYRKFREELDDESNR